VCKPITLLQLIAKVLAKLRKNYGLLFYSVGVFYSVATKWRKRSV